MEIERRKGLGRPTSCTSIFAAKLVCADCGGWFGKKVWGSYKEDRPCRREIWHCNDKYKRRGIPGNGYQTPHITEEDVKARFLTAFNILMGAYTAALVHQNRRPLCMQIGLVVHRFRQDWAWGPPRLRIDT